MSKEKNSLTAQKRRETNQRHSSMLCKVFDIKLQKNKLNKLQQEYLKMYFIEAKWIFNNALNLHKSEKCNIFNYKYQEHKNITKRNKEKQEEQVELKYLPAQCHQELIRYMKIDIENLSKKKKKGHKVGSLKFRSNYNSIDLRQYDVSYKLFLQENKIKICGIKGKIKVNGLKQIKDNMEIANAKLLQLPDGYHLKIITFQNKQKSQSKKEHVGLDFGIQTTITTSEGKKYDKIFIEESESIKRLQRKILRNQNKNSNNRYKLRKKLQKQFQKLTNKKQDRGNKIVADLLQNYQIIYMQDELISKWHSGWFGKQVQHSCLGSVKAKLKQSKRVVVIPSSFASTKICYICGNKQDMSLSKREYVCPVCGLKEDRDIKSAKSILYQGLKIGTEHIELTPLENVGSAHGIIYQKQPTSMN